MQKNLIISDIGGTNGRFARACFNENSSVPRITDIQVFSCMEHTTFDDMFEAYINTISGDIPDTAQLAIAGEMTPRHGNLWHFDWNISASQLEKKFDLKSVTLMNDYEAMVRAIPFMRKDDFFNITDFDTGLENGPYTVFGVGSGLGGSIAKPTRNGLSVVSSEIGHVSFGPKTALETELLAFTQKTLKHVSNESLLSGPGLERIYKFISGSSGKNLTAAEITMEALKQSGDDFTKTVTLFLDILASVAGDIALSQGARGGIYISGGIVPRLVNLIDKDKFIERFINKGPMADYVKKIPVKVITSDMPALLGAAMDID